MAIDPNNLQGTAHVTFDDEFNGLSLWSPNNTSGTWETTFWYSDPNGNGGTLAGNGEQEWYINSNYGPTSSVKPWTVSNGVLTLTAAPASSAISSLINGYSYTSGEVNTYHSFSQTYGYFEMRAQLPSGQGFWPAFWLMPEDGAWPPELDVMEVLGNNTSVLYNTVHSLQTGSHVATGDGGVTVADMSTGYHTYGVDWEADYVTFYFDGQAVYKTATPADMHGPMYMIANLAAGGYWPGNVTPGSVGQMNIDYVRAYASGAAAGATSASTGSAASAPSATTSSMTSGAASSSSSSSSSSGSGQTFTSDNNGDHWTGTAGNDTFNLGRGGDVVTGNGGTDTFRFAEVPWAGGHITDFAGQDVLDLAFLKAYGYTGSNPVADGHVKLVADGAGGTQVWANLDGLPIGSGTWLVTTLDGISAANLSWQNGHLVDPPAGGSSSSSTPSSSTSSGSSAASGQTFTSDNAGDHWTGTAGNDTFNLGRGGDVVTGSGGNDTFKFAEAPWNAGGHITDFNAGDVLDLTAMFQHYGYAGANPLSDGRLWLASDGQGGAQVWTNIDGLPSNGAYGAWLVTTLDHVAPSSLQVSGGVITEGGSSTTATAGGSSSTSSSTAGQTFTSDNAGDHWTGTAGNDTFNLGRGGDVVTGNGGNDTFKFAEAPWNAGGHITDFNAGDVLDLTGMFQHYGYAGSNPQADGHLWLASDGQGGAQVWTDIDGLPSNGAYGTWLVTTLDHVSASNLHVNGAFITG